MDFEHLPSGFAMGLAMNAKAMNQYGKISEAEKEEIIMRCKDAKSKDEMDRIVDSLADGDKDSMDIPNDLLDGPGIG